MTYQQKSISRPSLGTINVILATPGRIEGCLSRVVSIMKPIIEDSIPETKRGRLEIQRTLSFSDEDKAKTFQSHDDALVVTFRIGGYNVRKVLVD